MFMHESFGNILHGIEPVCVRTHADVSSIA